MVADRLLAGDLIVVVPHPDDEVIGLGGLLLRRLTQRLHTKLVFLTSGVPTYDFADERPYAERAACRISQAESVAASLGATHCMLDRPSRTLLQSLQDIACELSTSVSSGTAFLIPSLHGGHPDHDIAAVLGHCCARRVVGADAIVAYGLYEWNRRGLLSFGLGHAADCAASLILTQRERRRKRALLRKYETEWPRILCHVPCDREFFRISAVDLSSYSPGWWRWFDSPTVAEVRAIIAELAYEIRE